MMLVTELPSDPPQPDVCLSAYDINNSFNTFIIPIGYVLAFLLSLIHETFQTQLSGIWIGIISVISRLELMGINRISYDL